MPKCIIHHSELVFCFTSFTTQVSYYSMVRPDFIVGIIGNIVSIISFASSIGAFKEIVKKKSSENYKGVPYILTLLSTSLWTFYGLLDPDDGLLIATVNGVGVVLQIVFIIIFLFYASKEIGRALAQLVKYVGFVVLDLIFIGTVFAITLGVFHGHTRRTFVGFLCAAFTIGMYAAPLGAVRMVIRTKSVIYMPFLLSFSLFVNAGVWFTFAMLLHDYFVLVPNAVGIVLGTFQLILYLVYMNISSSSKSSETLVEEKVADELKNVEMKQDVEEGRF